MPAQVLVGYATRYGSTQEVAEAIAAGLREAGAIVETKPLSAIRTLDPYAAVVMGAPLYMFHWHADALYFLAAHRQSLAAKPVAVFALGPTHDPHDEKEWQDSQSQLDRELSAYPWFTPVGLRFFGGKYDPNRLRFPLRWLAGKAPATDIRDWDAIRAWAASMKPVLTA